MSDDLLSEFNNVLNGINTHSRIPATAVQKQPSTSSSTTVPGRRVGMRPPTTTGARPSNKSILPSTQQTRIGTTSAPSVSNVKAFLQQQRQATSQSRLSPTAAVTAAGAATNSQVSANTAVVGMDNPSVESYYDNVDTSAYMMIPMSENVDSIVPESTAAVAVATVQPSFMKRHGVKLGLILAAILIGIIIIVIIRSQKLLDTSSQQKKKGKQHKRQNNKNSRHATSDPSDDPSNTSASTSSRNTNESEDDDLNELDDLSRFDAFDPLSLPQQQHQQGIAAAAASPSGTNTTGNNNDGNHEISDSGPVPLVRPRPPPGVGSLITAPGSMQPPHLQQQPQQQQPRATTPVPRPQIPNQTYAPPPPQPIPSATAQIQPAANMKHPVAYQQQPHPNASWTASNGAQTSYAQPPPTASQSMPPPQHQHNPQIMAPPPDQTQPPRGLMQQQQQQIPQFYQQQQQQPPVFAPPQPQTQQSSRPPNNPGTTPYQPPQRQMIDTDVISPDTISPGGIKYTTYPQTAAGHTMNGTGSQMGQPPVSAMIVTNPSNNSVSTALSSTPSGPLYTPPNGMMVPMGLPPQPVNSPGPANNNMVSTHQQQPQLTQQQQQQHNHNGPTYLGQRMNGSM